MPQDTLARYLGRRRSRGGGRWQCYTVLSTRHSATSNTSICGVSGQGRYLEADMTRTHGSRRPIVVSFRRRHTQRQDNTGDSEVSGGSTSTGQEIYVSMEEMTKNRSRFDSCKIGKLKKTRKMLNETCISVICRHTKTNGKGVMGKSAKEGGEKAGPYVGFTSSPNPPFPCSFRQDTQPGVLMLAWHTNSSVPCLPPDGVNTSKEFPVTGDITENVNGKDKDQSRICTKSTKYPKVEDIEIFQEEHLKIQRSFRKQQRNSRHSRHTNKHKAQVSSCNSIECSFKESGDRLNLRFDAVRGGTAGNTDGTPHCAVSRSSTLPSLRSTTKERDTRTAGMSVPTLRHTQVAQSRCDILHHPGHRVRSMKRFARSDTNRKYLNFDVLGCENISKSESNVRNVTASLTEQNQSLNGITLAARRKLDDLSNYGVSHTATSGAECSFRTGSNLLSQKVKNNAIQLSLPEFPVGDGEVPDEKSRHRIQSSRDEEQITGEDNNAPSSPEDKNLALQNLSIFSAERCTTQNSNPSYNENSKTMEQFREYTANTEMCKSADSTPHCISRPKSCSDLTLSARQNCQPFSSIACSSSPRLTAGDLPV